MKINEWYIKYKKELYSIYTYIKECEHIFFIAAMYILRTNRTDIRFALMEEKKLNKNEIHSFEYILRQLKKNKPIQYITGKASFYGLDIYINQHILIPRKETEELVHWIIEENKQSFPYCILDIGTGSGCLALVLKKKILSHRYMPLIILIKFLTLLKIMLPYISYLFIFINQMFLLIFLILFLYSTLSSVIHLMY